MPDPIPVMVIGRLAIDQQWQGQGLGKALLQDAIRRTIKASEIAGMQAIPVHVISDTAKQFYLNCGFSESPIEPMTLMIRIQDIQDVT